MIAHKPKLIGPVSGVPDLALEPVSRPRTEEQARERLALLVALGFARVPAPLVARRLGRSRSTAYALTSPACVGGLRAWELALAPSPWASTILRGLLALHAPERLDVPSRLEVCRVLARAAQLVAASPEDLSGLSDQALKEQADALRDASRSCDDKAQAIEAEIVRRRQAQGREGVR